MCDALLSHPVVLTIHHTCETCRIYKERKGLTASLKDVSSAVAKLDATLMVIVLISMPGFLRDAVSN
jgi:hypothetical protein